MDKRGIFYDCTFLDDTFLGFNFLCRIKKVLYFIGKLEPSARQLGWITLLKYSFFLFHQS